MAENKIKIDYFPRDQFWKFWEKRKPFQIITWTKKGDETKEEITHFHKNGSKMDQHVYTRNREGKITSYTSEEYYSNGQISLQFSSNPYMLKTFYENGCLSGITTKDMKTCYFKNGKIQSVITKTPKQGINEYVEYTEEGNIKKKGLIEQPHGFEGGISNFITGNMEEKKKDESRQKFNDIIENINRNMSATEERKAVKEEIMKVYLKSKGSR